MKVSERISDIGKLRKLTAEQLQERLNKVNELLSVIPELHQAFNYFDTLKEGEVTEKQRAAQKTLIQTGTELGLVQREQLFSDDKLVLKFIFESEIKMISATLDYIKDKAPRLPEKSLPDQAPRQPEKSLTAPPNTNKSHAPHTGTSGQKPGTSGQNVTQAYKQRLNNSLDSRETFLREHDRMRRSGIFGRLFTKSNITEHSTLFEIALNATREHSRSREVFVALKWMDEAGNINDDKCPPDVKSAYVSASSIKSQNSYK